MAIWSKEMKSLYQRNIYLLMFIAVLFTKIQYSQDTEPTKCSSTDG